MNLCIDNAPYKKKKSEKKHAAFYESRGARKQEEICGKSLFDRICFLDGGRKNDRYLLRNSRDRSHVTARCRAPRPHTALLAHQIDSPGYLILPCDDRSRRDVLLQLHRQSASDALDHAGGAALLPQFGIAMITMGVPHVLHLHVLPQKPPFRHEHTGRLHAADEFVSREDDRVLVHRGLADTGQMRIHVDLNVRRCKRDEMTIDDEIHVRPNTENCLYRVCLRERLRKRHYVINNE